MNRWRSVLGITFLCLILPLAGPPDVSAIILPIDLNGCLLDAQNSCDLGFKQFSVTDIAGVPNPQADPRFGTPFAKVGLVVEAIDPGDFQTNFAEFEYRYSIFDTQYAITTFTLWTFVPPFPGPAPNFDLNNPNPLSIDPFGNPLILDFGSIPDQDSSTVTPLSTNYNDPGFFLAVFLGGPGPGTGPITPGKGSDTLYIRSSLSPVELDAYLGGQDGLEALFGAATLEGPGGSNLVATAILPPTPSPQPEPGTLILLGSGLLGLAGARLRRRRK